MRICLSAKLVAKGCWYSVGRDGDGESIPSLFSGNGQSDFIPRHWLINQASMHICLDSYHSTVTDVMAVEALLTLIL